MAYELSGKLEVKYDTQQITDTFKKREFVIKTTEEVNGRSFSNYVRFQCVQDRTALLDKIKEGDQVKVLFNIRGNRWEKEGRTGYITNLEAWRIEHLVSAEGIDREADYTSNSASDEPSIADDLPF